MRGTLLDVIDRLGEVDDNDPFTPLEIYAEGGSNASSTAVAAICHGDEEGK